MNAQRIRFAAARGATIQYNGGGEGQPDDWYACSLPGYYFADGRWRIHPDNEPLQYGPLSAALIKNVADGNVINSNVRHEIMLMCAEDLMAEYLGFNWWHGLTDIEDDMTRLFFAEYLADEGL